MDALWLPAGCPAPGRLFPVGVVNRPGGRVAPSGWWRPVILALAPRAAASTSRGRKPAARASDAMIAATAVANSLPGYSC